MSNQKLNHQTYNQALDNTHSTLKAVGLSGSPSPNSRSKILLEKTLEQLASQGLEVQLIDLAELPAEGLLGRRKEPLIDEAIQQATHANIVVLATPVYRATYTGQLKAFLDLFPQNALRGIVVGLIATGGSPLHALSIDHGLRPLVASLSGLSAAHAVYVTDGQFPDKNQIPAEIGKLVGDLAEELHILAQGLAVSVVQIDTAF
jgi:SsuE family FMN reductase